MNIISICGTSFNKNVHPLVQLSKELRDYLSDQINKCVDHQNKINKAIKERKSYHFLQELYSEYDGLIINSDPSIKRALEKAMEYNHITSSPDDTLNYWSLTPPVTADDKAKKLSGDQFDKEKDKSKKVARPSKSMKLCIGKGCTKEFPLSINSHYCSDYCTYNTAPLLLDSLLKYRDIIYLSTALIKFDFNFAKARSGDIENFRLSISVRDTENNNTEMVESIARHGFVTSKDMIDAVGPTSPTNKNSSKASLANEKKMTAIQQIIQDLPIVCHSIFTKPDGNISERISTRLSIEEVIIKSLLRCNVDGAASLGAVIGLEIEEELFQKYLITTSAKSKQELNKQEYNKHQLMLVRNLKRDHNDIKVRICNFY